MHYTSKILIMALFAILFFSCDEEQHLTDPGRLVLRTVDEDPAMPSITVNGAMLHAEAFGHPDSTLIVCIHGGPGGDYRGLLNAKDLVDEGYRVIFYDQRGSGLSQRFPKRSYTDLGEGALDLMYDDLNAVIQHYRKSASQKVFLIGHSWGGILATGFAGKYPTTIQGLVVMEPGGLKYADILDYVETSRSFSLWSELLNDATYLDQFMTGKEDQHEIIDYKMAMLASKNDITGEDNSEPGSSWRSGATISVAMKEIGDDYYPDFSEGVVRLDVPVLFIYSQQNKAYPDSWAQKISAAFNEVIVLKVNGTGHSGIISDDHAWSTVTMPEILSYFKSIQ